MFWIEKKHFQAIKRHTSYKVAKLDFSKRVFPCFWQKNRNFIIAFFFAHSFNIKCHKIEFVDVLDGQKTFLDQKKI